MERELGDGWLPARFHADFARPIPIQRLRVHAETLNAGRTVARVSARLEDDAGIVYRAQGLFIRVRKLDDPTLNLGEPPTSRDGTEHFNFPFATEAVGYHTAMDVRLTEGEFGRTPMGAWMRMRVPLVGDETPSPFQRVLCAADSGSGIGAAHDYRAWTFINADLDIVLHRALRGEWVGMRAHTQADGAGAAVAHTYLSDDGGTVGMATQALVVARR